MPKKTLRITKENLEEMGLRPDGTTIGRKRTTYPNVLTRRKGNLRLTVEFKNRSAKAAINGRGGEKVQELFDLLDLAYRAGKNHGRLEAKKELRDWINEDGWGC